MNKKTILYNELHIDTVQIISENPKFYEVKYRNGRKRTIQKEDIVWIRDAKEDEG